MAPRRLRLFQESGGTPAANTRPRCSAPAFVITLLAVGALCMRPAAAVDLDASQVPVLKALDDGWKSVFSRFLVQQQTGNSDCSLLVPFGDCDSSGNIIKLSLPNAQISGDFPTQVFQLSELQTLDLSSNKFNGSLPDDISRLSKLTTLNLGKNAFSGSLPSSLGSITTLQNLLLTGNTFSGSIPESLGGLSKIQALDLSSNLFFGSVPKSIPTGMPRLIFFDLSDNQLSGPLPSGFSSPYVGTSQGTYRVSLNFFSGAAEVRAADEAGTKEQTKVCPRYQGGTYAKAKLAILGLSVYGTMRKNCLDGGKSAPDDLWGTGAGGGREAVLAQATPEMVAACDVEIQRREAECVGFCGTGLPGVTTCNGRGTCYLDGPSSVPTCACDEGFVASTKHVETSNGTYDFPTCTRGNSAASAPAPAPSASDTAYTRGLDMTAASPNVPSALNPFFRYASLGFTGDESGLKWSTAPSVDWRLPQSPGLAAVLPSTVKEQGPCASCWATAPVLAMEAAYAIAYKSAPPNISVQQILDCRGKVSGCSGGWPSDAFDLGAALNLQGEDRVAYTGYDRSTPPALCRERAQTKQSSQLGWGRRRLLSVGDPVSLGGPFSLEGSRAGALRGAGQTRGGQKKKGQWGRRMMLQKDASQALMTPMDSTTSPDVGTPPAPPPPFFISFYEQIAFSGELGMMLAVQQQPIVANLASDQLSFITYAGGYVYSDPECFATGLVDHTVTIIGYDTTGSAPFWILRNSWGPDWGEGGDMRLAISGGQGTCGINTTPAMYPVVKGEDQCGPINPCGSGKCSLDPATKTNKCQCPPSFTVMENNDGSQTCGPAKVCSFFAFNPCGSGTCVDGNEGSYSCLCGPGYMLTKSIDGNDACIPAPSASSNASIPLSIEAPAGAVCLSIAATYGVSVATLTALNPTLDCSAPIPEGTDIVLIRDGTKAAIPACALPYSVSVGDDCSAIATRFGITAKSFTGLNPTLNCSQELPPGMQVCLRRGDVLLMTCTQWYTPVLGDTCDSIMSTLAQPPLSPTAFFALNPGLMCPNLIPGGGAADGPLVYGQQVCIQGTRRTTGASCKKPYTKSYTTTRGDTFDKILNRFFDGAPAVRKATFKKANGNMKTNPLAPQSTVCYSP